jgi:hypothetical protein
MNSDNKQTQYVDVVAFETFYAVVLTTWISTISFGNCIIYCVVLVDARTVRAANTHVRILQGRRKLQALQR